MLIQIHIRISASMAAIELFMWLLHEWALTSDWSTKPIITLEIRNSSSVTFLINVSLAMVRCCVILVWKNDTWNVPSVTNSLCYSAHEKYPYCFEYIERINVSSMELNLAMYLISLFLSREKKLITIYCSIIAEIYFTIVKFAAQICYSQSARL